MTCCLLMEFPINKQDEIFNPRWLSIIPHRIIHSEITIIISSYKKLSYLQHEEGQCLKDSSHASPWQLRKMIDHANEKDGLRRKQIPRQSKIFRQHLPPVPIKGIIYRYVN